MLLLFFIIFVISNNFIIFSMLITITIISYIFLYYFKKLKYFTAFYIFIIILIYLISAYFYTKPFLNINFSNSFINYLKSIEFPNPFIINHFHIINIGDNIALYNGTYYIPYNISLYEPIYKMLPFKTKVQNLINQTMIVKIGSTCSCAKPFIIKAKYKVVNESIVSNFNYQGNSVYLLDLRPLTITKIINTSNLNVNQSLAIDKKLASFVISVEYNGIIIS